VRGGIPETRTEEAATALRQNHQASLWGLACAHRARFPHDKIHHKRRLCAKSAKKGVAEITVRRDLSFLPIVTDARRVEAQIIPSRRLTRSACRTRRG
jgi:hypothetical protein